MLNTVHLIGYLGKDPEIASTPNGALRASLSIATSQRWRDRNTGELKESTEWHRCVAWRHTAEIVEKLLKKGDLVHITGSLSTRSWTKDGVTQYATEVQIEKIIRLSPKSRGDQGGMGQPSPKQINNPEPPARPADEIARDMIDNPYINPDLEDIPF